MPEYSTFGLHILPDSVRVLFIVQDTKGDLYICFAQRNDEKHPQHELFGGKIEDQFPKLEKNCKIHKPFLQSLDVRLFDQNILWVLQQGAKQEFLEETGLNVHDKYFSYLGRYVCLKYQQHIVDLFGVIYPIVTDTFPKITLSDEHTGAPWRVHVPYIFSDIYKPGEFTDLTTCVLSQFLLNGSPYHAK